MATREGPIKSTRTPIWIGLGGAGAALLATVINPLLGSEANEQVQIFFSETAKYIAFATTFFVVFWVLLDKPLKKRKLSRKPWPKPSQVFREALFSTCTQVIFIAVDIWTAFLVPASEKNSYSDIATHGWAYYAMILFFVFVIHDAYFYWMHRIMHHPKLYDRVHKVHHESTDPTPYSAFHFHPLEALGEAGAAVAMLPLFLLLPWHVSIPVVWGLGQLALNVIGHLGYEVYPSWWLKVPVLKWKNTAMHHYMHHQMVRGNYGLYFRWWDKICGTEFKNLETKYDALFKDAKVAEVPAGQPAGQA
ncbi:sterol desaturase/sphingolipid hydroxylase (fatty acid hydroxylase superfamily) [Novosphingobium capsulatum]|uniref:Sterol desaturase/sphingolipid hydroxylase (Fatty acid hydroxylase superfamily) n=1 Tax=Novosphingobium capsulatum TaxID=13688 RepID=A0ABU1MLI9_9SPHN|nr:MULTISPECIES: sterol desaturase family protein [Novosphingobium]MBB3358246.1 sterol desaturase/sphingolipid hydroxylase (fatty acid hydroxylase superfamily) [Novosphingobium sp. BK256]MBB3374607.1 sterol desaturase/sphingolipid hydroxylase (fatty acid hydroxylase superfamily) [Novosphingobium sp. BK280]MBB3379019.1 sterol desaturase/sphingolipid hydroxylase (fatty acid hydroxylase superfamily) [Novosphingobium sp. BK258]MBB3420713.1 sterol desaturase/sphingolipid hydroxylase (fatty acid hydr